MSENGVNQDGLFRKIEKWIDSSTGMWVTSVVGIGGMVYCYVSFFA